MLVRLRWLTILVPALVVGGIELVSDTVLDEFLPFPWDALLVVAVVLAFLAAFLTVAFRRIDALATALAARNEELERRNATARALHRVSVAVTTLEDLDDVLRAVVDEARALLRAEVALLLLADGAGELTFRAASGPASAIRRAGDAPGRDAARFIDPALGAAQLAAPLQRGGETIGQLVVASREQRSFDVDDLETLASLANQAAIALENARLQARLRELAVVAERERIAREMHDGLAQVLGYVNTKSQAVESLLESGRIVEARGQLAELAAAARSIYVDVREAILGLRSPIMPEVGLVGAIEAYAGRFAEASKLAVTVGATAEARALDLPPDVQAEVFRIVQEALTNVRKHAGAGRAEVALSIGEGSLFVSVADDGRGFEPTAPTAPTASKAPTGVGDAAGAAGAAAADGGAAAAARTAAGWPHYGLQAMRERAAAIGGSLAWTNREGDGALVRLTVPLDAVTWGAAARPSAATPPSPPPTAARPG